MGIHLDMKVVQGDDVMGFNVIIGMIMEYTSIYQYTMFNGMILE